MEALILGALIVFAIYFLPAFLAFGRSHPNRWLILLINTIFGVTFLGWAICLLWSLNAFHRSSVGSPGGESGLNVFINDDAGFRQAADHMRIAHIEIDIPDKLLRLKQLRDNGAIDVEEYEKLRGALVRRLSF